MFVIVDVFLLLFGGGGDLGGLGGLGGFIEGEIFI